MPICVKFEDRHLDIALTDWVKAVIIFLEPAHLQTSLPSCPDWTGNGCTVTFRLGNRMFGTFQQTTLRIEVNGTAAEIRDSLLQPRLFKQWMWPQTFPEGLPGILQTGTTFTCFVGPLKIQHEVSEVSPQSIRFMLWEGIDGFHEWYWGDEWVQSRLEGVSLLPLNLAQNLNLWKLKNFLRLPAQTSSEDAKDQ